MSKIKIWNKNCAWDDTFKVTFNTSDTQKAHPHAQTTSFEPSYVKIRCELWSVGELTKQKEEKK